MENTIQSDLIRGHIDTIILKALFDGDRYGYDIVREIEQKSSGQYKLKQPTLYSCLKRLEVKGLVRAYWGAKSNGGRRKYFTLTEMGRELFIKNQSEWEYSRTIIDKLISDREFDLQAAMEASEDNSAKDEAYNNEIEENAEESENTTDVEESDAEESEIEEVADESEAESLHVEEETVEHDEEPQSSAPAPRDITFADTTAIMNELFRQQQENFRDVSYSDKLVSEKYVADKTQDAFSSDTYFKDFYDETETAPIPSLHEEEPTPPQSTIDEPEPAPVEDVRSQSATAQTKNEFLDYHSPSSVPTSETAIIEREYRNILGDFVNLSFESHATRPTETKPDDAVTKEQTHEEETQTHAAFVGDAEVNRKLNKLTGDVRDMGDNITIRTHDNKSAKEYNNAYLYYSNKLGLVHYGILFGMCILAVVFTAVLVHPVMQTGKNSDKWFYLAATLLSVVLPVTAFVKYSRDPEKRKRINYGLKFSLICRLIIMIQCLVIVYLVNVMAGMPASFDKEYLSTLLLPALFCLLIPVSTLIFNALFKSRRFAVE